MQPFTTLDAVAAPIEPANVDTDQIIPARFMKKPRDDGYDQYLFHDLRFDDDGDERPDFILNRPEFRGAHILVANSNFGCGSSRESAVYALDAYGIRAVIAPSFGDIFHNNCLKNGILPVRLDTATVAKLRSYLTDAPGSKLIVDLDAQTVADPSGAEHNFDIDPFWKEALAKGLDEIGMTRTHLEEIEEFERRYHAAAPWLA